MKSQLELHKPPPPGQPIYWNIPLLLSLGIIVVGLLVVFSSLADNKKIMLALKCVGPCLVMLGVTFMLLRILFTYKPTCLVKLEKEERYLKFIHIQKEFKIKISICINKKGKKVLLQ